MPKSSAQKFEGRSASGSAQLGALRATLAFAAAALIVFSLLLIVASGQQLSRLNEQAGSRGLKPLRRPTNTAVSAPESRAVGPAASSGVSNGRLLSSGSLSESSANSTSPRGRLNHFVEDELPVDFYEMPAEQLDLGMNATGRAPMPILNVAVLRDGSIIDNSISVHPGTPLEMVIYLDDKSAKVYGLLVSYLKVQDDTVKQREEVVVLNGCSVDKYIFENFEHNPEDKTLRAKFKAFKFPESNFVRFVGTVNVCIKQCADAICNGNSNNNAISQRKKRALPNSQTSSENINNYSKSVQMTVSTVLRIGN